MFDLLDWRELKQKNGAGSTKDCKTGGKEITCYASIVFLG